jgi:L-alanine-DL-glutamate epimerase-like enolase superfamily enzyme
MDLEIESVEVVPLWVPLVDTPSRRFESDASTRVGLNCVGMYLHTKNGPKGFGYSLEMSSSRTSALTTIIENLEPSIIGMNALQPAALWDRVWKANHPKMLGGLGMWALSIIDNACWDVLAKSANMPLNTLLGGFKSIVPVYGSGGRRGLSDADLVTECVEFAKRGVRAYKFKIGDRQLAGGHSSDETRIALLRGEMGDDFVLFADGNQNYDVREAIEVSRMLRDYGIAWFEEPVIADSVSDLAAVAAASSVPIAAGENVYARWGFKELCETRAAAYLQPDLGRCGGVSEAIKIAALADAYNLKLCTHVAPELAVSVVGAFPCGYMVEYLEHAPDDLWSEAFAIDDGFLHVPQIPGHGVDFSDEAKKRYAV